LKKTGFLASKAFKSFTSEKQIDRNDRVLYEKDTGDLYYDSNGSRAGGRVHIAELDPWLALRARDIEVI
jgi:serralysin